VQRMRDVLESPVLAALRRHRHEQPGVAVDHLQVADHEAVVEGDRDVGLEPLLTHRKDPHLGDVHEATPQDARQRGTPEGDGTSRPDKLSNARLPACRQGKFAREVSDMSIETSAFQFAGAGACPEALISRLSWCVLWSISAIRSLPLPFRTRRWSAIP